MRTVVEEGPLAKARAYYLHFDSNEKPLTCQLSYTDRSRATCSRQPAAIDLVHPTRDRLRPESKHAKLLFCNRTP